MLAIFEWERHKHPNLQYLTSPHDKKQNKLKIQWAYCTVEEKMVLCIFDPKQVLCPPSASESQKKFEIFTNIRTALLVTWLHF